MFSMASGRAVDISADSKKQAASFWEKCPGGNGKRAAHDSGTWQARPHEQVAWSTAAESLAACVVRAGNGACASRSGKEDQKASKPRESQSGVDVLNDAQVLSV